MQPDLKSDDTVVDVGGDDLIKSSTVISSYRDPSHVPVPLSPTDGEEPETEVSSLLHSVNEPVTSPKRIPLFAWPLLVVSLASVSSAGVVFASLPDVPTFTLAAWRLQTTGLLLVPGAIYQYITVPAGAALQACSRRLLFVQSKAGLHPASFAMHR